VKRDWWLTVLVAAALVVILVALTTGCTPPSKARQGETRLQTEWIQYDVQKALYLQCLMADFEGFDGDPAPCLDEHGDPVQMPEPPSEPRPL